MADAALAIERPGVGIDAMPSPVIAHRANFGAIYSGTLGPTGTTFTGTPDIFNNQAVPVSIPALATTTLLSYAWFVRWW